MPNGQKLIDHLLGPFHSSAKVNYTGFLLLLLLQILPIGHAASDCSGPVPISAFRLVFQYQHRVENPLSYAHIFSTAPNLSGIPVESSISLRWRCVDTLNFVLLDSPWGGGERCSPECLVPLQARIFRNGTTVEVVMIQPEDAIYYPGFHLYVVPGSPPNAHTLYCASAKSVCGASVPLYALSKALPDRQHILQHTTRMGNSPEGRGLGHPNEKRYLPKEQGGTPICYGWTPPGAVMSTVETFRLIKNSCALGSLVPEKEKEFSRQHRTTTTSYEPISSTITTEEEDYSEKGSNTEEGDTSEAENEHTGHSTLIVVDGEVDHHHHSSSSPSPQHQMVSLHSRSWTRPSHVTTHSIKVGGSPLTLPEDGDYHHHELAGTNSKVTTNHRRKGLGWWYWLVLGILGIGLATAVAALLILFSTLMSKEGWIRVLRGKRNGQSRVAPHATRGVRELYTHEGNIVETPPPLPVSALPVAPLHAI